jgi:ParB family chromosome partitioning protein
MMRNLTRADAADVSSLTTLALEIAACHQQAMAASRTTLQHARRCGALLTQAKAALRHGQWLGWLKAHCPLLSPRVAQTYMKLSQGPVKSELNSFVTITAALRPQSSDWYTPAHVIDAARAVMGGIDVDPASCRTANQTVRAARYFTVADDGLTHPWPGRVWLNPPFSGRTAAKFVRKAFAEYDSGRTTQAVLVVSLLPVATAWFRPLLDRCPLCFVGRIPFVRQDGVTDTPAITASVIGYLGPHEARFAQVFEKFGPILRQWNP